MIHLVRRWSALTGRDRLVVVEALVALAVLPAALRLLGVVRVASRVAGRVPADGAREQATRVARLVEATAGRLPWRTSCLHRALATALEELVRDAARRRRLGEAGRARAARLTDPAARMADLAAFVGRVAGTS